MSEKHVRSPEADSQAIADLYMAAADCLETAIFINEATIEPVLPGRKLKVGVGVPEISGKSIHLEYERTSKQDDPTKVDRMIPLATFDDDDRNLWHTPIEAKVYVEDNILLHSYVIEYTGRLEQTRVTDYKLEPGQDYDECGSITMLDAQELIAQMETAVAGPMPEAD